MPYIGAVLVGVVPLLLAGSALYAFLGPAAGQSGSREAAASGATLGAALALLALTVVGMFLAIRLMLSSAVASAENISPIEIIRRSWALSRGNWWRLFIFLMLFAIGAICVLWATQSVFGLLVKMLFHDTGPLTVGGLLVAIVSQLVSATISVIFFVLLARIYAQRAGADALEPTVPKTGI